MKNDDKQSTTENITGWAPRNPIEDRKWTEVFRNGKQFLLH